jgi:hypothetical protein
LTSVSRDIDKSAVPLASSTQPEEAALMDPKMTIEIPPQVQEFAKKREPSGKGSFDIFGFS